MGLKQINRKYKSGFLAQVDASIRGEITSIPVGLNRVGTVFNLLQYRYTLISGATGSGKTSFTDYLFILSVWRYLKNNPENIYWETIYFSLERKEMFKHAKWLSWFIYKDHKHIVSADELMGWGQSPVNTTGYNLIRSYDDEMTALLERVKIYDGKFSPKAVSEIITTKAFSLGTFYHTDNIGLYIQGELLPSMLFSDLNLIENTPTGPEKYLDLMHNGESFRLYTNDHKYFMTNPKSFIFIVIDGINLIGDKTIIDTISIELANARDLYGFSPVVVTQQNRAMGDIQRLKLQADDLSPQLEDIFKSSQMGFDADLVLGLFDPYRYKAYDAGGKYDGYILKPPVLSVNKHSMLSPLGQSRFRSIHILKNTFGAEGLKFALKFLGECNHFETLPFPDDILMENIYAEIKQGI